VGHFYINTLKENAVTILSDTNKVMLFTSNYFTL